MKIAIIGHGYVGKAFEELVKNHYELVIYDPKENPEYPQEEIDSCELAVVCVPTPMKEDGRCDTSIVKETVKNLNNQHILIKSTVVPGTTEYLQNVTKKPICFSPEYISESTYFNPIHKTMLSTPFLVVGGPKEEQEYMFSVFEPIMGPHVVYYGCDSKDAELIKYMANSFMAMRVTFVNEFYEIVKAFGGDWHRVREGWLLDERVGRTSTTVFPDKRGYGGKCLPKDTNAIAKASEDFGYSANLIKEMIRSNNKFVKKS